MVQFQFLRGIKSFAWIAQNDPSFCIYIYNYIYNIYNYLYTIQNNGLPLFIVLYINNMYAYTSDKFFINLVINETISCLSKDLTRDLKYES